MLETRVLKVIKIFLDKTGSRSVGKY